MIRKWRADLLGKGVSVSMAAKAYRLFRAILATAVEEDKILPRNPCRVRGAGEEHAPERPVLTVFQVFDLSELVGRRPVGNIRKLSGGGYSLADLPADSRREIVAEVSAVLAVDASTAEDLVRSAEPLWDASFPSYISTTCGTPGIRWRPRKEQPCGS
jgi:hypothetical protein